MKIEIGGKTGTLKELNVKPRDVVEWVTENEIVEIAELITDWDYNEHYQVIFDDGFRGLISSDHGVFRMISRASTTPSPVRTVTKLEIVPGVYGPLEVYTQGSRVGIKWHGFADHADLTAAIETLTAIKEAME